MTVKHFKVLGLKQIVTQLENLDPKQRVKELRKVGRAAMEPVIKSQQQGANVDSGDLRDSIGVRTRTGSNRDRKRLLTFQVGPMKKSFGRGDDKRSLSKINQKAVAQEFGNEKAEARPFIRPSLAKHKHEVLARLISGVKRNTERAARGRR